MNKSFVPTRRQFLAVSATALGGMMVGFTFPGAKNTVAAAGGRVGYFLEITPDNSFILHMPKPEIGQGVHTSLPMLLAEELDIDFTKVSVRQLPVALLTREGGDYRWKYGGQDVGGSTSVWNMWEFMRQAGAEARRRLVTAAAERWNASPDSLTTEKGHVLNPATGERASYGDLAAEAAAIPESDEPPPLRDPSQFTIIGTSQPMKGVEDVVTGQAEFGIDAAMPGMLFAFIKRAPKLGAKIKSFDAASAMSIPGVRHVVPVRGPEPMGDFDFTPIADGVAVVADSRWAALKGREALRVEWTEGVMEGVSSASLDRSIRQQMEAKGQVLRNDGSVDEGFANAERVVEAWYDLPLVSHATLEPQGCIAHVHDGGCDLIIPTQDSSDSVIAAARRLDLPIEKIRARVTRVGGGFGRRLDEDYVPEAVDVAKAVGRPVHVLWTREDDMRNDFYRPLAKHHLRAGIGKDGRITAWQHRLATTGRYFRRPGVAREDIYTPEYWLDDFPAGIVDNMTVEYFFVETAIPTGPWRGPGHTANVFAVQSFLDEIADELGEDPLALRLQLLGAPRELPYEQHGGPVFDTGRLANVLRIAARNAGWGEPLPPRHGRGIAGHFTFGTYVTHVIDVRVDAGGELKILRVHSAVDCGIPVNINGIKAQCEGAINDGLSAALGQAITLEDGAIVQGNFDTYQMMRIGDAPPEIDVEVVRSAKEVRGMGEPAIPPVAPALCNAIFQATGRRIRALPIADQLKET